MDHVCSPCAIRCAIHTGPNSLRGHFPGPFSNTVASLSLRAKREIFLDALFTASLKRRDSVLSTILASLCKRKSAAMPHSKSNQKRSLRDGRKLVNIRPGGFVVGSIGDLRESLRPSLIARRELKRRMFSDTRKKLCPSTELR
jgi:hypothetical protein